MLKPESAISLSADLPLCSALNLCRQDLIVHAPSTGLRMEPIPDVLAPGYCLLTSDFWFAL